jgi:hypothetical protein
MHRIIFLAGVVSFLSSGCCKESGENCPNSKISTGLMVFHGDCGWVVESVYDGNLKPTNLPLAYQRPGFPVRVWYEETGEYDCDPDPNAQGQLHLYQIKLCDIEFNEDY